MVIALLATLLLLGLGWFVVSRSLDHESRRRLRRLVLAGILVFATLLLYSALAPRR